MTKQYEKETHQMVNDIFEAIDIIATKRLEKLEFDRTIKCQIIDASNSTLGEYLVTDGLSEFIAYSDNKTFNNGHWVFVTVPNNDFSQQKVIMGKCTSDDAEYYTYINPLNTYVNMTGNFVGSVGQTEYSLIANNTAIKEIIIDSIGDVDVNSDAEITEDSKLFSGFNRLGIQAKFCSALNQYELVDGHYGICIRIKSLVPSINNEDGKGYTKWTKMTLDSKDMFGNPYDFFIESTQQSVFDISGLGNIVGIIISFYQNNDFINVRNDLIPVISSNEDADLVKAIYLSKANLFVNDVQVSLGYDLGEFEEDNVLLHTFDSLNYNYGRNDIDNTKNLLLKWIHFDDKGNLISIDSNEEIPTIDDIPMADIHWYKWKFADNIEDEIAGTFWEEIVFEDGQDKFNWSFMPNTNIKDEQIKVIIQYPSNAYLMSQFVNMEPFLWAEAEEELMQEHPDLVIEDPEYETLLAEIFNEKVKTYEADLRGGISYYESNIIEFTNEREAINMASVNLIRGLEILCDVDGGRGVYRCYDTYGQIINKYEAIKERELIARFDSVVLQDEPVHPDYQVTWFIPAENTMIELPERPEPQNGWHIITQTQEEIITDEDVATVNREFKIPFKIKNYFSKYAVNNTVKCEIIRNNITYTAEYTLYFSTANSNGTEYSITADFIKCKIVRDEEVEGITILEEDQVYLGAPILWATTDQFNYAIQIVPHILDNNGEDVTEEFVTNSFNYSLLHIEQNYALRQEGRNCILYIKDITENDKEKYYHCVVNLTLINAIPLPGNNGRKVNLFAYYPVAISFDNNYISIIGDDRIIYDDKGSNPQYYSNPYQLIDIDNKITEALWSIKVSEFETSKYYPQISNEGMLDPTPIYMSNLNTRVSILAMVNDNIVWCQPLYINQNIYTSKLLNEWDGHLEVDEENNYIMSAMVGAGYKDSNNTFNGVLLGDVGAKTETTNLTGLYGYYQGQQSFGFTINGTAFIGRSGSGRIEFNGEKGVIKSANYDLPDTTTGMLIDLDDGLIHIKGDSASSGYPLKIGSAFKVAWDGAIDASKGIIGGWTITDTFLTSRAQASGTGQFALSGASLFGYGNNENGYAITVGDNIIVTSLKYFVVNKTVDYIEKTILCPEVTLRYNLQGQTSGGGSSGTEISQTRTNESIIIQSVNKNTNLNDNDKALIKNALESRYEGTIQEDNDQTYVVSQILYDSDTLIIQSAVPHKIDFDDSDTPIEESVLGAKKDTVGYSYFDSDIYTISLDEIDSTADVTFDHYENSIEHDNQGLFIKNNGELNLSTKAYFSNINCSGPITAQKGTFTSISCSGAVAVGSIKIPAGGLTYNNKSVIAGTQQIITNVYTITKNGKKYLHKVYRSLTCLRTALTDANYVDYLID